MKYGIVFFCLITALTGRSQAKLVINGAVIVLDNAAVLVIDNPDNTAITQTGSGYISSEAMNNRVYWSVGPGNGGVYQIPFGNASDYLPVSFVAASGSNDGYFIFSTYSTPTWKNSDDLPSDVTNVNSGPNDNSAHLIDRFWQINPEGYVTKPSLQNLTLAYAKSEIQAPNTIIESSLITQRWNNVSDSWSDYFPTSVINTAASKITVPSIPGTQLFDWWTLVDGSAPLPVTLAYYYAVAQGNAVINTWQTNMESNSSRFEIWKSKDLSSYEMAGSIAAAGTSETARSYAFTDSKPYPGISYYRLKSVDLDGKFTWSQNIRIQFGSVEQVVIYPNPASSWITLSVPDEIAAGKTMADIYDMSGRKVQSFRITSPRQLLNISTFAIGTYHMYFIWKQQAVRTEFIKN